MTETVTLTEHDAVRDWAAARMGTPAIVDVSASSGTQPMVMLVFDQIAYQDQDQAERAQNAGGRELVEWSDWFEVFDNPEDAAGRRVAESPAPLASGQRFRFHFMRRSCPEVAE